ncbi:MAG TPA: hypothetical protein PL160_03420 [Candidatus Cloacimonas sp.]|nr:hypothetical protein [Candidatus Cloacimonas sp.]
MKNSLLLILAVIPLLLLLSACESGAKLRVINLCSYPAYVKVEDGAQVTVPAGSTQEFKVETRTKTPFSGEVKKDLKVWLIGETYSIFNPDTNQYTDSTTVTLTAGETLEAYLNPNRACIRVTNSSSKVITDATIWQTSLNGVSVLQMGNMEDLAPGESRFLRVPFGLTFYYRVGIQDEDGGSFLYGDVNTILNKDQQYHVVHTDPE